MQRSRNAVINWLSRVTTPRCGRKKCACERASERAWKRASISRTRSRSFRCNSRSSDPNFSSPRNGTVLFALVICAGCDLSSVFSKPSSGHRAPNESFVSFYRSVVRIRPVSYYIRYNGGFGFAEIRYFTRRTHGRESEPCFKQSCSVN